MAATSKILYKLGEYLKVTVPRNRNCRYLGYWVDHKLTYRHHIQKTRDNFRPAKNKLYPLIARNSKLSVDSKLLIYRAYLRPLLTYGCQVWSHASKTHIKTLIRSQNATNRQIASVLCVM